MKKVYVVFLSVIVFLTAILHHAHAQILIAGTSFDPLPGNEGRTYIGINDIVQYGFQTGSLTIVPPIAPNVNTNTFNNGTTEYHAITDNPFKLDNTRFNNIATPDYQLVFNGPTGTPRNFLTYKVTGLQPGSNVQVRIRYCNPFSATQASCGPGEIVSVKGVVNPDQYNTNNGLEGQQVSRTNCASLLTITQATNNSQAIGANGEMTFYLNAQQNGLCKAVAITSIEIWGTPAPRVLVDQGEEVCVGEQVAVSTTQNYNGTYQWQFHNGSTWSNITGATNKSLLYDMPSTVGTYQFRAIITPPSAAAITSTPVTVRTIVCCQVGSPPVNASRQTVYYDNFGRLNMANTAGTSYYAWDYTNVLNPVEVLRTTTTPFRWPLTPAPLGATFRGGPGPLQDGDYAVAAFINGYNSPIDGYAGARLEWASRITGTNTIPNPDLYYDHSGQRDGAALLLNCPPFTLNQVMYSRTINNLCFGKQLFFQCWITVFTNGAMGPYNPVNVKVRLTDGGNPMNVIEVTGTATNQNEGGGVWVPINAQITLTGTTLLMEIINNQNVAIDGNDLVLDDIKIMACSPPAIDLYFDLGTLAQNLAICQNTDDVPLFTKATALLNTYYGGNARYLFQWTKTPNVFTSWTNLGTPQTLDQLNIADALTTAPYTGFGTGDRMYYRVIAASPAIFTANNNFVGIDNANINDPCKDYSVSPAIEVTRNCPLPVDLLSFKVQSAGSYNQLQWVTANEQFNHYFSIERSTDGIQFSSIGQVSAATSDGIIQQYQFEDRNAPSSTTYYRLKQVDLNGAYTYSSLVVVQPNTTEQFTLYPNPSTGSVALLLPAVVSEASIEVLSITGSVVQQLSTTSDLTNINGLTSGVYLVKVTLGSTVQTQKLIIE
ncbi:MAG: T9SS type A sorting domain-containing protein [Cytophagaceae bacterium]|jgi:hypothetical protein|nr:T9SS type A sorting domain-containing protein [Cytophagaceae bacterium]